MMSSRRPRDFCPKRSTQLQEATAHLCCQPPSGSYPSRACCHGLWSRSGEPCRMPRTRRTSIATHSAQSARWVPKAEARSCSSGFNRGAPLRRAYSITHSTVVSTGCPKIVPPRTNPSQQRPRHSRLRRPCHTLLVSAEPYLPTAAVSKASPALGALFVDTAGVVASPSLRK